MNRHQRRAAAKSGSAAPPGTEPDVVLTAKAGDDGSAKVFASATAKPGLLLRILSKVILSGWVLNRVNHPQLLALLEDVAVQAGRPEVVVQIQSKKTFTK